MNIATYMFWCIIWAGYNNIENMSIDYWCLLHSYNHYVSLDISCFNHIVLLRSEDETPAGFCLGNAYRSLDTITSAPGEPECDNH